jgi:hypothetical protein
MRLEYFAAIGLVVGPTFPILASTDVKSNPYQQIPSVNVFRLRPPIVDIKEDKLPPPPRIVLQGIVSVGGNQQVLFKSVIASKPGQVDREFFVILNAGGSHGEITVLEINERAGTVRFSNHGKEQLLSLEKDSVPMTTKITELNSPSAAVRKPGTVTTSGEKSFQTVPLSAEEQAALIELNRRFTEKQVQSGEMPPLPPTGLPR